MLVQSCINNVTFMTMLTQPCDKIVTLQQHTVYHESFDEEKLRGF